MDEYKQSLGTLAEAHANSDRITLNKLIEWMRMLLRNQGDDRTFEAFEDLDRGGIRVRAFVPTPNHEPEESIVEATLHIEGITPTDDHLVRIEIRDDVIFCSYSAWAIASILLG